MLDASTICHRQKEVILVTACDVIIIILAFFCQIPSPKDEVPISDVKTVDDGIARTPRERRMDPHILKTEANHIEHYNQS